MILEGRWNLGWRVVVTCRGCHRVTAIARYATEGEGRAALRDARSHVWWSELFKAEHWRCVHCSRPFGAEAGVLVGPVAVAAFGSRLASHRLAV